MPSEPADEDAPPVPSVWRLGWLLFMQPTALYRMYRAWGLEGDPSLIRLWRSSRARSPVVRALMARYALLLLVVMPLATVLAVGGLTLAGVPLEPRAVAIGVVGFVVLGVVAAVVVAVARGMAFAVAMGVAGSMLFGIALHEGSVPSLVSLLLVSGTLGVSLSTAFTVAAMRDGKALGAVGTIAMSIVGSVLIGLGPCSVVFVIPSSGESYTVVRVEDSVIVGAMFGVMLCRLPLWLAAALFTQLLAWRMRRRPDAAGRLASWLPIRHDDLIYLPLPGLRVCLIQVAEVDPELGKELIALAAASIGQRRSARLALIELQARALERAALDSPFLPGEADLPSEPANAPILAFLSAARDLKAGSTNQRQRRLALERARSSLESFRVTTVASSAPSPLARQLLPAAALWLDLIRDVAGDLAREATAHPEVPAAFIAGPPLSPERAEERTVFKGRADLIKVIEHDLAPDRRGVLLVVGQRRMGKTSLCNWLPTYLGTGTTVVVSNFQPLSGDAHRETPHRRVLDALVRSIEAPAPPESARWGDGLRWLEEIDRACTDRKILVVIDEVERVEDGIRDGWCSTDFLDFLRAAGDALRHIRFLLLTAYPLHRLGPHWTDRLVSVTSRSISYLDERDARELLTRPIPEFPDIYPEGGVDLILEQTGRHPYLLQKFGDDLCRLLNSRGGLRPATLDELTEVFDGMIRDLPLFNEIWRSRTEDERATLKRLAQSDEPGEREPAAIQLEREGYLERRGDGVTFVVPLFREWIRTNQGNSLVSETRYGPADLAPK